MNLLGWSERHSEHKTTLGCYPEDETRIKDGKERLELKRGSGGHTGLDLEEDPDNPRKSAWICSARKGKMCFANHLRRCHGI